MNKDTKLIFIMMIIIILLAGIFIFKLKSPSNNNSDNTIINSIVNETIDKTETNPSDSFVIYSLEDALETTNLTVSAVRPVLIIFIVVTVILIIIKSRNPNSRISNKIIIGLVIYTILFGIHTLRYVFRSNAIEYAIENKSWYIEEDVIKRVETEDRSTYIYLEEHGKMQLLSNYFSEQYKNGDEVEVLMVKGKLGGKYEIGIK